MNIKGKVKLIDTYPCLSDQTLLTSFDPHYFYQSAWISRQLAHSKPAHHYDVGSDIRISAMISAFIPVSFIDIRPLKTNLEGLDCSEGSLIHLPHDALSLASLSCLHVLEHVGLGRYGDPLDPDGHIKAISELKRVIAPGGYLYISTPVGKPRIHFNAHRVFNAVEFSELFKPLSLISFHYVNDLGEYVKESDPSVVTNEQYACGLYTFKNSL